MQAENGETAFQEERLCVKIWLIREIYFLTKGV